MTDKIREDGSPIVVGDDTMEIDVAADSRVNNIQHFLSSMPTIGWMIRR